MAMMTLTIIGKSFRQSRFQKLDVVASYVTTMSSNYFTSTLRATFLPTMSHLLWCPQTKSLPPGQKMTTAAITRLFSNFHLSMVMMATYGRPSQVISDWPICQQGCRCGPTLCSCLIGLSNNRKSTGTKIRLRKVRHGLLTILYSKVCNVKYLSRYILKLCFRRWRWTWWCETTNQSSQITIFLKEICRASITDDAT